MANKKVSPFELSQALNQISNESVFDILIKEIDAKEIPAKYVEYISVSYKDGNTVELSGHEIAHPIPLNKNASFEDMETSFRKVKNVRVFIDTKRLEVDVTAAIDKLLKGKLL